MEKFSSWAGKAGKQEVMPELTSDLWDEFLASVVFWVKKKSLKWNSGINFWWNLEQSIAQLLQCFQQEL